MIHLPYVYCYAKLCCVMVCYVLLLVYSLHPSLVSHNLGVHHCLVNSQWEWLTLPAITLIAFPCGSFLVGDGCLTYNNDILHDLPDFA